MDLSKANDCLPHDLIIAKFEAYGLSKSSLSLLLDCLTSRKQTVKIGSSYSVWNEIKRGVPQGSILGALFFNVFINDIFMFTEKSEICNRPTDRPTNQPTNQPTNRPTNRLTAWLAGWLADWLAGGLPACLTD